MLNVKPNRTITTGDAKVLWFVRSVDTATSIFFIYVLEAHTCCLAEDFKA